MKIVEGGSDNYKCRVVRFESPCKLAKYKPCSEIPCKLEEDGEWKAKKIKVLENGICDGWISVKVLEFDEDAKTKFDEDANGKC